MNCSSELLPFKPNVAPNIVLILRVVLESVALLGLKERKETLIMLLDEDRRVTLVSKGLLVLQVASANLEEMEPLVFLVHQDHR